MQFTPPIHMEEVTPYERLMSNYKLEFVVFLTALTDKFNTIKSTKTNN